MRETRLPLPYIGLIAGTRTALGVGIGLLVAQKLRERARRSTGLTLVVLGALTTIPLVLKVASGVRRLEAS